MPSGTFSAAMSAAVSVDIAVRGFGEMNSSIPNASTAATAPRMNPNLPAAAFRFSMSCSVSLAMLRSRGEIDVPFARIDMRELHAKLGPDVDARLAAHQPAFHR